MSLNYFPTEPGGYLHWDEADCGTMKALSANPSISYAYSDELVGKYHSWSKAFGVTYESGFRYVIYPVTILLIFISWVSEMDRLFVQNEVKLLGFQRLTIGHDIAKPWTEMVLMGYEEIFQKAVYQDGTEGKANGLGLEGWRVAFEKSAVEHQRGAKITMDMVTALGRKAI